MACGAEPAVTTTAEGAAVLTSTQPGESSSVIRESTPASSSADGPATFEPTEAQLYPDFKDPAADMSSKPLFFWNTTLDEMTEEGVREIVRRSYEESGYSGFGILPYWQEGDLSEQYLKLYEAALDEGSKYGMKFSLYDENGFPSYTAGVKKSFPHKSQFIQLFI